MTLYHRIRNSMAVVVVLTLAGLFGLYHRLSGGYRRAA